MSDVSAKVIDKESFGGLLIDDTDKDALGMFFKWMVWRNQTVIPNGDRLFLVDNINEKNSGVYVIINNKIFEYMPKQENPYLTLIKIPEDWKDVVVMYHQNIYD